MNKRNFSFFFPLYFVKHVWIQDFSKRWLSLRINHSELNSSSVKSSTKILSLLITCAVSVGGSICYNLFSRLFEGLFMNVFIHAMKRFSRFLWKVEKPRGNFSGSEKSIFFSLRIINVGAFLIEGEKGED